MKSFFRLILLALILLVVALVSALTAMRFAIHGREALVPDFVGKTPFDAARLAEQNGLQLEVEREYYSASVPEGRILSQAPLPGVQVRRGWKVRVARSLGAQRAAIPNVIGQSQRAAEINVRRRGLEIAAIAEIPAFSGTPNEVVAQNPSANASGVSSPKISFLVTQPQSTQSLVMPNFVGQTLAAATDSLQSAGFRLGNVAIMANPPGEIQASPGSSSIVEMPLEGRPSPMSVVITQNPVAGQTIALGASVDLKVR